jgi:hypothetical protein
MQSFRNSGLVAASNSSSSFARTLKTMISDFDKEPVPRTGPSVKQKPQPLPALRASGVHGALVGGPENRGAVS